MWLRLPDCTKGGMNYWFMKFNTQTSTTQCHSTVEVFKSCLLKINSSWFISSDFKQLSNQILRRIEICFHIINSVHFSVDLVKYIPITKQSILASDVLKTEHHHAGRFVRSVIVLVSIWENILNSLQRFYKRRPHDYITMLVHAQRYSPCWREANISNCWKSTNLGYSSSPM